MSMRLLRDITIKNKLYLHIHIPNEFIKFHIMSIGRHNFILKL